MGSTNLIPSHTYVSQHVSVLRRVTSLPVVLTVRTSTRRFGGGGKEAADLLKLALRLGIDRVATLPTSLKSPHSLQDLL